MQPGSDRRGPEPPDQPGAPGARPDPVAYAAEDGTPRSIPIAFTWNGSEMVMRTTKNAPKLRAVRHNPAVALMIDTEVNPPKILLVRGRAELDVVEGIPDEYLQMNGTYAMTDEQRVEWEAEVRSLYDGMVRIVMTPAWAKLIEFETTLPSAVEELARSGRNGSAVVPAAESSRLQRSLAMSDATPLITGADFGCVRPFVKRYGSMPGAEYQAGNLTLAVMHTEAFGGTFSPNAMPIAPAGRRRGRRARAARGRGRCAS